MVKKEISIQEIITQDLKFLKPQNPPELHNDVPEHFFVKSTQGEMLVSPTRYFVILCVGGGGTKSVRLTESAQ